MAGGDESLEVVAVGGRRGPWTLWLEATGLRAVANEGGEVLEVPRGELPARVELQRLVLGRRVLVLHLRKRIYFQVSETAAQSLESWLGPLTVAHLGAALRRQLRFGVVIAAVFLLASIPTPATETTPAEGFDAASAGLGVAMLVLSAVGRVAPHRGLFAAYSVWLIVLMATLVVDMAREQTFWWGVVILLLVVPVNEGFRQHRRFAAVPD